MAVARPVRGTEPIHVDRYHPGRVGRVDERVDAAPVELRDELRDREDQPGHARDVTDHDEARPWRNGAEDRVADDVRTGDREGIGATTTRAPSRAATARIALIVALYS